VNILSWIQMLSETYDLNEDLVGKEDSGFILLPISHSTANAQIEVAVDYEGNFLKYQSNLIAKTKEGKEEVTIIPVTEDSAARSSGIAPHPLADKLCYVAGDYTKYTGNDKREYYEAYMEGLKNWKDSSYTHPMIQAIYAYLKKGILIKDLVDAQLLQLNEYGILNDKTQKIHNLGQTAAFIRFKVCHPNTYGEDNETWKNEELYQKFVEYYANLKSQKDLCYVTGKIISCTDKHPAKIRNTGDKAKLISANDESGFTYLGRFTNKSQAVSVGYETSQKAHLALRWLLQKQGYRKDGAAMVVWCMNQEKKLPWIWESSDKACAEIFEEEELFSGNTGESYADQFNLAMKGYAKKFELNDKVILISLDAATTGRLSINYYHEFEGNQFMERLLNWYEKCNWSMTVKKEGGGMKKILVTPSPQNIALVAFGTERSNGFLEADSRLITNTILRLLPCMTNGRKETKNVIPADIIKAAVVNISRPQAVSTKNWNFMLRVTCALLKYDKFGGDEKNMALETEKNREDRDVLFGRLLAILEKEEQDACYVQNQEKEERQTNAKKYWSIYQARPAKTCEYILRKFVAGYEEKLNKAAKNYFNKEKDAILLDLAKINGFNNNPLKENYLIGYALQKEKIYTKKQENKGGKENE